MVHEVAHTWISALSLDRTPKNRSKLRVREVRPTVEKAGDTATNTVLDGSEYRPCELRVFASTLMFLGPDPTELARPQ